MSVAARLTVLHGELDLCTRCPSMIGPVVHGPPIPSSVYLLGQAPGPHEGRIGRPFAWTAGKTLFKWIEGATGAPEALVRERIYFAAVARCFPGKAKSGGDRVPDPGEITRCRTFIAGELEILKPRLVIPVGALAIGEVLGVKGPLKSVVGQTRTVRYHGVDVDVIALPHPSGASTWHRTEPGKTLLDQALRALAGHEAMAAALADPATRSRRRR